VQFRNVAIELGTGIEGLLGMLRVRNGTAGRGSAGDGVTTRATRGRESGDGKQMYRAGVVTMVERSD
jgi:hypothetical protein